MDELLEVMEKDPDYKQYIMDGQIVIFEDYLEIRPEKREQVEEYIKQGRITAGPWYTLPELYPLDGECMVRNLLKGYRVSEKLGKTMKIACTSFGWGQTAQFPQIYKGFGMDFCITAKRVSEERAPKSEFCVTARRLHARAMVWLRVCISSRKIKRYRMSLSAGRSR